MTFVVVGLLELLLELLLFGIVGLVMAVVLWQFVGVDGKRHCPACQRDGLEPFDAFTVTPGRLTTYRCVYCGAGYRVQLDGSLDAMPEN